MADPIPVSLRFTRADGTSYDHNFVYCISAVRFNGLRKIEFLNGALDWTAQEDFIKFVLSSYVRPFTYKVTKDCLSIDLPEGTLVDEICTILMTLRLPSNKWMFDAPKMATFMENVRELAAMISVPRYVALVYLCSLHANHSMMGQPIKEWLDSNIATRGEDGHEFFNKYLVTPTLIATMINSVPRKRGKYRITGWQPVADTHKHRYDYGIGLSIFPNGKELIASAANVWLPRDGSFMTYKAGSMTYKMLLNDFNSKVNDHLSKNLKLNLL